MASRKAQAAMEFLMSYGWAILVVLAGIAMLSYFDVIDKSTFVTNECTLPAGVTCIDFNLETGRTIVVLQNNFDDLITVDQIDVASDTAGICTLSTATPLKKDEKGIFTVIGCTNGNTGDKFDGAINVTYTRESSLTHVKNGIIRGKIRGASTVSSQNTCQNAETGGLCGGLDIVYGQGYRTACCSEHTLCCT